ncbi:hypothetical protein SAMN04515671_3897 [Nakamurella panacisegetis]|uniref:Uncharacterized protein n=1 Tax=Nakamurella panacisegetis TaxID=1090615 RepID=A0A1H0S5H4_9ACTN|nr:hypothetical protein [Nakamurella panacisegetis]SDP36508.1 hypothetical protein SAMN04515671_3897 [Nakamurella panacisegetis]
MVRSSWKLSLTMGTVVLGALLATTSSASGAAPEPESTPSSTADQTGATVHIPTLDEAKSFRFMSREQYKAAFGEKGLAAGRARAAAIAAATNNANAEADPPTTTHQGN